MRKAIVVALFVLFGVSAAEAGIVRHLLKPAGKAAVKVAKAGSRVTKRVIW